MPRDLLAGEGAALLSWLYLGTIIAVGAWECVAPRRACGSALGRRWFGNFALVFINSALTRAIFPFLAVGLALFSAQRGWGLLHLVEAPLWAAIPLSLALLDLGSYAEHRVFHRVPLLWRIHRVHHSDPDCDFTTAFRFHPLEAGVSVGLRLLWILLLGAPPTAVLLYEILSIVVGTVEHGNLSLGRGLDRALRLVLVTPDMHRVHHSADRLETDSNFGAVFPVWDRLLGSYCAEPAAGPQRMTFGLLGFREPRHLRLGWLLAQPFLEPSIASTHEGEALVNSPLLMRPPSNLSSG